MKAETKIALRLAIGIVMLFLVACGGGSDGESQTTPSDVNSNSQASDPIVPESESEI